MPSSLSSSESDIEPGAYDVYIGIVRSIETTPNTVSFPEGILLMLALVINWE